MLRYLREKAITFLLALYNRIGSTSNLCCKGIYQFASACSILWLGCTSILHLGVVQSITHNIIPQRAIMEALQYLCRPLEVSFIHSYKWQSSTPAMYVTRTYTICSLYLPPSTPIDWDALESLIQQLSAPYLILGDHNGRHPMGVKASPTLPYGGFWPYHI